MVLVSVFRQVSDEQESTTLYSRVPEVVSKQVIIMVRNIRETETRNSPNKRKKTDFENLIFCTVSDIRHTAGAINLDDRSRIMEADIARIAVMMPKTCRV